MGKFFSISRRLILIFLLFVPLSLFVLESSAQAFTSTATNSGTTYGGPGGNTFSAVTCSSGYVVTSVSTSSTTDPAGYIIGFGFICTQLNSDGTLSTTTESKTILGSPNSSSTCSSGYAAIGLNVNSSTYISDAGVLCKSTPTRANSDSAKAMARNTTVTNTSSCDNNSFIVGFGGKKGAGIDNIYAVCSYYRDFTIGSPTIGSVNATSGTLKSISISWNTITNASSYSVLLYDSSNSLLSTTSGINGTSKTLTTSDYSLLANATSYKIGVQVERSTFYDASSVSTLSSVTTNSAPTTPTISSQPISISKTSSQTASFSVSASISDLGSISFQWQKSANSGTSWADILGATSTSYTTGSLTTADSGSYFRVIVKNSLNGDSVTVTSNTAILTVNAAISISGSSTITTTFGTETSTTYYTTGGTGTKSFAITKASDASSVSGISIGSSSGVVSVLSTLNAGTYSMRITATDTASATSTKDITVAVNARHLAAPGSITTTAASTTAFTVSFGSVVGATSFTARVYNAAGTSRVGSDYTNFTIGQSISGLDPGTTYEVSLISVGDGTNNLTSSESALYSITTLSNALSPIISTQPSSKESSVGKSITLSLVATSPDTGTLTYQWQKNGADISGANSDFYILNPLTTSDAGSYTCVVTNSINGTTSSLTSNAANLTVNLALGITGGSNISTTVGTAWSSSAFATTHGTGNKTFSLGESIAGISVNPTSGIVTAANNLSRAGSPYTVHVIATDEVGSSDSTTMTITVNPSIAITSGVGGGVITKKYGSSANSSSFTASDGTGSISFTVSGTNAGVTISSGTITVGTSLAIGSYYETVTATDSVGSTAKSSFRVDVTKADTVTVTAVSPSVMTYTGSPVSFSHSTNTSGLMNNDAISSVSYSYGSSPACANGGTCAVGDRGPAGGIVFYVSNTVIDSATGISDGGTYLEAAPNSFSKTTYNWCEGITDPYTTSIGGTSNSLGAGAENTRIVSSTCSGGAVKEVADLTLNGLSDWFLPSQEEQVLMYNQRAIIGMTGTEATYLYWGSSETANWHASSTVPWSGVGVQNKGQATPYWPIRAFNATNFSVSNSSSAPTNAGVYTITPSNAQFSAGSADNYVAILYETSTATISKATQNTFSGYSNLSATFGQQFTLYPVGGSGDGYISYSVSDGSATGCALTGISLSSATQGSCSITFTKAASQNYLQASSTFSINFFVFEVVQSTPASSTNPHEILSQSGTGWSITPTTAPIFTSVSPISGPIGTTITINGTGLSGVTTVKIGRKLLTNIVGISDSQITAQIPAGTSSGPIFISNGLGSDFSATNFAITG